MEILPIFTHESIVDHYRDQHGFCLLDCIDAKIRIWPKTMPETAPFP